MESAQKFFNYYTAGEWHDGNGKPVKNWKQKAIAVWFKPENTDRVISERQPTKFITEENKHELDN